MKKTWGRQNWVWLGGVGMFIFMLAWSISFVEAEPKNDQDPLIEHLEFMGYECDLVEGGIRAKHFSNIHIFITYAHGGIRFVTGIPGKISKSQDEEGSRYHVTNALMNLNRLTMTRLYWGEKGDLFAMAWMPGTYDKARFAVFMKAWDRDTSLLREAYKELKPYLKEESTPSHSSNEDENAE